MNLLLFENEYFAFIVLQKYSIIIGSTLILNVIISIISINLFSCVYFFGFTLLIKSPCGSYDIIGLPKKLHPLITNLSLSSNRHVVFIIFSQKILSVMLSLIDTVCKKGNFNNRFKLKIDNKT